MRDETKSGIRAIVIFVVIALAAVGFLFWLLNSGGPLAGTEIHREEIPE